MRVNADGTVLIPREYIQALGLKPGEELALAIDGRQLRVASGESDPGQSPGPVPTGGHADYAERIQRVRGSVQVEMTTEELMRATRFTDDPL
jgi:bifunctional DNA-binding transcriptional regulator/antitoxin component of YhaV-PrlF toxin-antitoxin module